MRYFSALWARMYRFSANSRATISSTAIFFSQQSRQYRSSPRGSETSFAPQSAHLVFARFDLRVATHKLYLAGTQSLWGQRSSIEPQEMTRGVEDAAYPGKIRDNPSRDTPICPATISVNTSRKSVVTARS